MSDNQRTGCLAALLGGFVGSTTVGEEDAPVEVFPYLRVDSLLTQGELAFYDVLRAAVAGRYLICPKVRLADLLDIRKGTQSRQGYFNRIQSKHIDFVLVDLKTLRPLLALELDDASHRQSKRQKRDEFVDTACEAAGLPILRVPAKAAYNAPDLSRSIDAAIQS